jgi:predicted amidophosphoribosyltransferase
MVFSCLGCQKPQLLRAWCTTCQLALQPNPTWWPSPTHLIRRVFAVHTIRDSNLKLLSAYKNYKGRAMKAALSLPDLGRSVDSRAHYDWILPVPDDHQRLWKRRHSAAYQLAQCVAEEHSSPIVEALARKQSPTSKQALQDGLQRRLEPPHWTIHRKIKCEHKIPKSVLIVDDFIVSGTTIHGIAEVLREGLGNHLIIDALCLGIRRIRKELDQAVRQ